MNEETQYDISSIAPTASLETLLICAEAAAEGLNQTVSDALYEGMHEYFMVCMSPSGVDIEQKADPREHRSRTIARLVYAGLSKAKAESLYRRTLGLFAEKMHLWIDKLEGVSEPFIDSLTFTPRAVHHSPKSTVDFLEAFVAPINGERDGFHWKVMDGGNKHYLQRVNVYRNDLFYYAVFFDLKTETEHQNSIFVDCSGGFAQQTWEHFRDHVEDSTSPSRGLIARWTFNQGADLIL
ncbi:hypothetical protein [Tropicibacter alexandrii]|uniref:hypothetical protein n=1 Tax=Tropicibacter alexandrii TaxID=2267683 RepID=UPI000EF5541A|nr:hypothetical protein [Tropicibacter alexandrii]